MKYSFVLPALVGLAVASPTPTINEAAEPAHIFKRATISEKATIGYASANGGFVQ
jgi:pectate lyase